jgi:lipopolysaccharide/colanic/teichoic acid biosynthesis glycosyltransferase
MGTTPDVRAIAGFDAFIKRLVDIVLSVLGLMLTFWLILLAAVLATVDTGMNGFFTQKRVGKDGRIFKVIKIRTMRSCPETSTTVTTSDDARITALGGFFRKAKIDELPQLINVLVGQMSMVGPRPDVPGFADRLQGDDRIVLSLRPGITGPATLYFRNEEQLLAQQEDPEAYNRDVIYRKKIKLNMEYISNYSVLKDFQYIWETVFPRK